MSLSDLSGYEINERIAKILYSTATEFIKTDGESSLMVYYMKDGFIHMSNCIDAVNDDALAFRLMVENKIDQYYDDFEEEYVAERYIVGANNTDLVLVASSRDASLNRAIAECFLLMNGVES